jgi:hypothetical protein
VNKIIPPSYTLLSLACLAVKITVSVTVPGMMCHFLQLPLPTGTQTHSCYSLDHSSEYHSGLSRPVYHITCVSVHPFADLSFMFYASHTDFVFPFVCATPSFFIYAEGTNCDICITNFHTALCLLSHVKLYKNIAVEAKHYFQL